MFFQKKKKKNPNFGGKNVEKIMFLNYYKIGYNHTL